MPGTGRISGMAGIYRRRYRLPSDFTVMKQSRRPARPLNCTGMRLFSVFLICGALLAQAPKKAPDRSGPQKQDEGLASITVDVNVVSVLASVRDKKGALIPNLTKDDFTILEDGKPQPIKY